VKNLFRIVASILLLAATLSTNSFADGGTPLPECPPGVCLVN
jgi:hypothetical protein